MAGSWTTGRLGAVGMSSECVYARIHKYQYIPLSRPSSDSRCRPSPASPGALTSTASQKYGGRIRIGDIDGAQLLCCPAAGARWTCHARTHRYGSGAVGWLDGSRGSRATRTTHIMCRCDTVSVRRRLLHAGEVDGWTGEEGAVRRPCSVDHRCGFIRVLWRVLDLFRIGRPIRYCVSANTSA